MEEGQTRVEEEGGRGRALDSCGSKKRRRTGWIPRELSRALLASILAIRAAS